MNAERTHCIAGPLLQHPDMSLPRRPHLGPPLRLLWMGIGAGFGEFPHYKLPVGGDAAFWRGFRRR